MSTGLVSDDAHARAPTQTHTHAHTHLHSRVRSRIQKHKRAHTHWRLYLLARQPATHLLPPPPPPPPTTTTTHLLLVGSRTMLVSLRPHHCMLEVAACCLRLKQTCAILLPLTFTFLINSSGPLNGRQEEVIEYIASQPSFDAEVGCPVYYAIHFRNLPGLKSLLAHSSQTSLKECVRSLPSNYNTTKIKYLDLIPIHRFLDFKVLLWLC